MLLNIHVISFYREKAERFDVVAARSLLLSLLFLRSIKFIKFTYIQCPPKRVRPRARVCVYGKFAYFLCVSESSES